MYQPSVISLDFETQLTDGSPSTEFYRRDFRVTSCAFAWRGEDGSLKTAYREGERAVRGFLVKCGQIPLVAHNAQFELAVLKHRFKDISPNLCIDTMRLVQVGDGGSLGMGLEKSVSRWLPAEYHAHKQPFYAEIIARGGKKGKEGENLHLLSPESLEAYNVADAKVTLLLFETLTAFFKGIGYDWRPDHELFFANLPYLIAAEAEGVLVDRGVAEEGEKQFIAGMHKTETDFLTKYASEIAEVERLLKEKVKAKYKTEKGRDSADYSDCKFNIYSTTHLRMFFIDVLGLSSKFMTKKGNPTFGAKLIWQYGEPGLMLDKKGRYKIQRDQAQALSENSERDGRWHPKIKAAGTRTDRYAGGEHEGA